MQTTVKRQSWGLGLVGLCLCIMLGLIGAAAPATAQMTAFKQAVAEAASDNRELAAFYRENDYAGLWTGASEADLDRRRELFRAIENAELHGLPHERYDPEGLMAMLKAARSPRDLGLAEVRLSKTFLELARNMQSGILTPSRIVNGIKREVAYRAPAENLTGLATTEPRVFFRSLLPRTNEYNRLIKEKLRLERLIAAGGWGPAVAANAVKPGESGNTVVALRNRLIAMGYLTRNASRTYDAEVQKAVQAFQRDHGLKPDGIAGAGTLSQINIQPEERLKSVMVAMERERWLNKERGSRHVLVNLTDFSARIIDEDRVSFTTRAVVGKNTSDRRSPEFSDVMEHLVINPTWHVPRSIAVKEYLPMMKRNPNAAGHLRLVDSRGRTVSRGAVNFGAYSARNFPYAMKQPPSSRNALGLVKFMFPNKYNIYLHDTPAKSLFQRARRDFSHGCIRLHQPFDFAYEILSKQEAEPKEFFHSILRTGRETKVELEQHVPVHIIYRTAFTTAQGRTQYREDVYGRDARIWDALERAGVSLISYRG